MKVSGAESVRFDFFDRATWAAALDGVESLFLLFPLPGNTAARTALVPFVKAAQDAGCRHVVYVSVFGADRAESDHVRAPVTRPRCRLGHRRFHGRGLHADPIRGQSADHP